MELKFNFLKLVSLPHKILFHFQVLGIQGISLLLKRNIKKYKNFNVLLPKYKHSILLRNNTTDVCVFYQVFLAKSYDIYYGFEPEVIIDCGANIGLSAIYFKNRFPEAKIIAIEPEMSNFELLKKNTEKYDNIFCIRSGIWNTSTNLIIKDENSENWGFVVEEVDYKNNNTIPAISIDEIISNYGINQIDILKIDIEGSEKELFEINFENWLKVTKVLIIELHDGLRQGASKSFFRAISRYDFKMSRKNENLIFYLK